MEINVPVHKSKPRLGHRVLAQAGMEDIGRMFCFAYNGDIHIGFKDKKGDMYTVTMTDVVKEIVFTRDQEDLVDSIASKTTIIPPDGEA